MNDSHPIAGAAEAPSQPHPGLADLLGYPLMAAIQERRTRRVAQGTSILAGDISHTSTNPPAPLSPLEEAVLITATGLAGAMTMHDGPLQKPEGGAELGTPFLNVIARAASSPDNAQATSFFMINDQGNWLIRRPRGRDALALLRDLPPRWAEWKEEHWLRAAESVKHRLSSRRLEFPRQFPYYLGWNKQHSNAPGTTIFFPVVDCTRQVINAILILLSEPDGQRPVFVDDWQPFRPRSFQDWLAWIGARLRLTPAIPYQPIGGVKWVRNGFVNRDNVAPLGMAATMRTDHEAFLLLQNLMLVGQGLGLGGWVHSSVFAPWVLTYEPAQGWYGLGFRFHTPERQWRRWPPVPAFRPNPVGIDGILEGLCPPYVPSMADAVDQVLEEKYGAAGAYGDRETFARSYTSPASADEFLRAAQPHPKKAVEYTKEICTYIYETYGRFPAHVDAFHVPGIWVQFSHLELPYYEKYFDPALFRRQAEHAAVWGAH
jgi:hypothetical protein